MWPLVTSINLGDSEGYVSYPSFMSHRKAAISSFLIVIAVRMIECARKFVVNSTRQFFGTHG